MANHIRGIPQSELSREDLPEGYEEAVIADLRFQTAITELLRLNDQVTIDGIIARIREARIERTLVYPRNDEHHGFFLMQDFKYCRAPFIIDELAPLMYEGIGMLQYRESDGPIEPWEFRQWVAGAVAKVVENSLEFSPEVRASAKAYRRGNAEIVLVWWEENRTALIEERYGDVTPMADSKTFNYSWRKAEAAAAETASASPVSQEETVVATGNENHEDTEIEEPAVTPESAPYWPWLLLAIVASSGIVFGVRRIRTRRV